MKIICSDKESADLATACVEMQNNEACDLCPLATWCVEERRSVFGGLDDVLEVHHEMTPREEELFAWRLMS